MKAFPTPSNQNEQGMDLRDYFAAKAMQAFLTGNYDLYPNEVAKKAYQIADWMMKARNETA
jgi:hypothetical protein